jgi:hypothetical protein
MLFQDVRRFLIAIAIVVMSWVLAAGASAALSGCHDPDPITDPSAYQHRQEIKAEATYEADTLACTAKSKTLAESKACEALVDARWHVDAGTK